MLTWNLCIIRFIILEFYDQSIKEHMKRFDSNDLQDLVDLFLLQHYQKAYTFEVGRRSILNVIKVLVLSSFLNVCFASAEGCHV